MDDDLDLFSETVGSTVRTGPKFQPKAKPRPRKEKNAKVPEVHSCDTKEKPVPASTILEETLHSISPIDTCTTILASSSPKLVENQEPLKNTEVLQSGLTQIDGNEKFASKDISPRPFMAENVDSRGVLCSEITNCDIHEDLQTCFARSGKETADIFSELESLDAILSDNTTINALSTTRKFQPKVKGNGQPRNKLPISCPVTTDRKDSVAHAEAPILHAINANDLDEGPSLPVQSSIGSSTFNPSSFAGTDSSQDFFVSQEPVDTIETGASDYDGDVLIDNIMLEGEEAEAFPGLESLNVISQITTTARVAQFICPETEYLDEDLTTASPPEGFLDFSATVPSDSAPTAEFTSAAVLVQAAESQGVPTILEKESTKSRKRKNSKILKDTRKVHFGNVEELSQRALDGGPVLAEDEGNGTAKSSRQRRKRSAAPIIDDGVEDGTTENGTEYAEPSNYSLVDEDYNIDDDNEHKDETSHCKKARSKAAKASQNEKKVRKRKNSSDGPATSKKEPPKKKFSHRTRRPKRQVNKALLETPEEEINPRQLILKDLILLAEAKERIMNKNTAALKKSLPNQSVNNSSAQDAPYHSDDPYDDSFASMQGLNPDDGEAPVQEDAPIHNYHSFMDKKPRGSWSKQDDELFYDAIRQFGTDFAMIQQLFPGRTRHQVKLKYKKEDRLHPSRISDALTSRSKEHFHFELVIQKLRQAAAEAENDGEEREGAEADDIPETNGETGESERKLEGEEQGGNTDDMETASEVVQAPHGSEEEDQYQSDCEEYIPF